MVQVVGNPLFERWANLMGDDHWLTDERFASDEARGNHGTLISERMTAWTVERTTAEAVAELEEARIPCGEILTPAEALENEQVVAMGFFEQGTYPDVQGNYPLTRLPLEMSNTPGKVRRRPPMLSEHTNEILMDLGYSTEEIDELKRARVV